LPKGFTSSFWPFFPPFWGPQTASNLRGKTAAKACSTGKFLPDGIYRAAIARKFAKKIARIDPFEVDPQPAKASP